MAAKTILSSPVKTFVEAARRDAERIASETQDRRIVLCERMLFVRGDLDLRGPDRVQFEPDGNFKKNTKPKATVKFPFDTVFVDGDLRGSNVNIALKGDLIVAGLINVHDVKAGGAVCADRMFARDVSGSCLVARVAYVGDIEVQDVIVKDWLNVRSIKGSPFVYCKTIEQPELHYKDARERGLLNGIRYVQFPRQSEMRAVG
ncbi:Uncharacterised protein [uncultured archaeon]|nr:Uncharacterised protein [uncultured archaeon]